MNVELRTAKVIAAEAVPKSKKLIKLQVDLGTEQRTILAGIAEAYQPESLVGTHDRHRRQFEAGQADGHRVERHGARGQSRRREAGARDGRRRTWLARAIIPERPRLTSPGVRLSDQSAWRCRSIYVILLRMRLVWSVVSSPASPGVYRGLKAKGVVIVPLLPSDCRRASSPSCRRRARTFGIARSSRDPVLEASAARCDRQAERVDSEGRHSTRIRRAAARLPRVGAESTRHSSLVADAGLLREQPAASHISQRTPRAIYFNDTVAVAWAKGAETIEATALDPTQGVHFYSIPQTRQPKPQFVRRNADCLQCHLLPQTHGVPGVLTMSVLPLSDNKNDYAQGWEADHRTPIEDRWGGWYVTGAQVPAKHLGNVPVLHVPKSYVRADVAPKLTAASDAFDASAYLTPHSDVVALMVLNHQTRMTNLLTRLGWQSRIAAHDGAKAGGAAAAGTRHGARARRLHALRGRSAAAVAGARRVGFYQGFPAKGPRDSKGRSLRDLDLTRRLLRYPCSYMIYTEAFDALPAAAKAVVYERMWAILSGTVKGSPNTRNSRPPIAARSSRFCARRNELPAYLSARPAEAGLACANPSYRICRHRDRLPLSSGRRRVRQGSARGHRARPGWRA